MNASADSKKQRRWTTTRRQLQDHGRNRLEWLAAFGLLLLVPMALTWIAVDMGLTSPNAEAASNNAMPLILLPLISSAFTPVDHLDGHLTLARKTGTRDAAFVRPVPDGSAHTEAVARSSPS